MQFILVVTIFPLVVAVGWMVGSLLVKFVVVAASSTHAIVVVAVVVLLMCSKVKN